MLILQILPFLPSLVKAKEDYFFSICSTAIATNSAFKCKGFGRWPNVTCQCTNQDFIRTLYLCIDDSSRLADADKAVDSSWDAFNEACSNVKLSAPSLNEVQLSLEDTPVTQTFLEANTSKTGAFRISDTILLENNVPRAGRAIHRESYIRIHWGEGLIGYIFGIMVLQIVLNLVSWILPGPTRILQNSTIGRYFRKYISMPTLFNGEQAEPFEVMNWPLMFPLRIHALLIAGLYALVIVFLTVNFSVVTSPFDSATRSQFISLYLAYRCAWFALYLLVPAFLFAGRNNFLIWLTGWQFSTFIVWHKHLARLATLLIVMHASCFTILFSEFGTYGAHWDQKYFVMGFVAILSMSLACIQAVKFLRARGYDIFVHIHFALAVVTVASIWEHLKSPKVAYEMLYSMIAVWGFDRVCRIGRVLLNKPGSECEVKDYGDVLMLKIKYSHLWKPTAGSYVFVHFLHPLYFFQSHPFTALYELNNCAISDEEKSSDISSKETGHSDLKVDEKGCVKLFIKKQKGFTKNIGSKTKWRVLLDGPYGVQFNMAPYHEMVFLAGGIGITGVYNHLKHAISRNDGTLQSVTLYWSIRDLAPLIWFQKEIMEMSHITFLNVNIHISTYEGEPHHRHFLRNQLYKDQHQILDDEDNIEKLSHWERDGKIHDIVKHQRVNINELVLDHIHNSRGPLCFFACGPGKMCDNMRVAVANNLNKSKNLVQYYEEAFAF